MTYPDIIVIGIILFFLLLFYILIKMFASVCRSVRQELRIQNAISSIPLESMEEESYGCSKDLLACDHDIMQSHIRRADSLHYAERHPFQFKRISRETFERDIEYFLYLSFMNHLSPRRYLMRRNYRDLRIFAYHLAIVRCIETANERYQLGRAPTHLFDLLDSG